MNKINTKKIVPLLLMTMAAVFAFIGFTQSGFWHETDGPQAGFFPSIMAIVMFVTSIVSFFQSLKETEKADYKFDELMVVGAGIGIFVATFIIGLVPTILLYLVLWLKLFEKSSWKATLIVVAVVMFITMGVFGGWLGIQFPMGMFENIL